MARAPRLCHRRVQGPEDAAGARAAGSSVLRRKPAIPRGPDHYQARGDDNEHHGGARSIKVPFRLKHTKQQGAQPSANQTEP